MKKIRIHSNLLEIKMGILAKLSFMLLLGSVLQLNASVLSDVKTTSLTNSVELKIINEQTRLITGTVVDEQGLPLPGVNVLVENTTIGIGTDFNGNFKINVPMDAKVLVFSFVGFISQKVNIVNLHHQDEIHIILKDFTNYFKFYNDDNSILTEDLYIYLNDKNITFKNGQVIKLVFANNMNFASYNLKFYTDYNNIFKLGSLKKNILNINQSELSSKPIIELICINQNTFEFDYNIIK